MDISTQRTVVLDGIHISVDLLRCLLIPREDGQEYQATITTHDGETHSYKMRRQGEVVLFTEILGAVPMQVRSAVASEQDS